MDVRQSEALADWLDSKIQNLEFCDVRAQLSASCFQIVHEHHRSIVLLVANRLYGSAFALVRPIYEAFARGWLLYRCNTEKQMQRVIDNPSFQSLVSAIKKKDENWGQVLDEIRKRHWHMFNSFTHTGFEQIARQKTQKHIEPNYDEKEVADIVGSVDALAILAGCQFAIIADKSELALELNKKAEQYYRHKPPPVCV